MSGSRQLALARVLVCAIVLLSGEVQGAVAWARGLSFDQLGDAALLATSPVAIGAQALAVGGALLGLVGIRAGLAASCAGLVVLLGLRQLGAGPVHAHHLVWLTGLLACTPCCDAWAPGAGPPVRSAAHDAGIRAVWAVLGAVYLFPGLHKLAGDWVTGDALVQTLWWKWAQSPDLHPIRLDLHPVLARAASIGVVVFELAVGPALQFRRTRPFAAVAALAFHAGTAAFAGIHFGALWVLFLTVVPVDAGPVVVRDPRRVWAAAGALLGPIAVAGALGAQGWPFACYPRFDRAPGPWMPTVAIVAVTPDGEVPVALDGPQRLTGELWGLRTERDVAAFAARHPEVPEGARFYRATRSVVPGDDTVLRGALIAALPVSDAPPARSGPRR